MSVIISQVEAEIDSPVAPAPEPDRPVQERPQGLDRPAHRGPRSVPDRTPLFGVYPAMVVNLVDPEDQGRVKIRLPWSPDPDGKVYEAWARIATLMAGPERGSWFMPDLDDEVLVAFEAGDPRRPYVVGALWNGRDAPPEQMDRRGDNHIKSFCSRSGIRITLNDQDGQESLVLKTPGGQEIRLEDESGVIEIKNASGGLIKLDGPNLTLQAGGKIVIDAGILEITAGMLTVNAGISRFSGMIQADTVQTNTVIANTYTPGAGNVW